MAGAKVPAPLDPMVNGDDWTNILARLERTYKGYDGVSLTNWAAGNTKRPKIAAGSVIEIDGAPFEYATDETIVDGAGLKDGWCYIKHVVSGDAVTPTLTNTFGTWDTAKQGFYDGSGNRFSLFAMYRSGAITKVFTDKAEFDAQQAKLGYWYYEKLYTGTTTQYQAITTHYGIICDETILPISNVVNVFGMVEFTSGIWLINDSRFNNEFLINLFAEFEYRKIWDSSQYDNKPYKVYMKYKFDL